MSKRKFTLPHSDEKIKEMEAKIKETEERLESLHNEVEKMNQENWNVRQAEEKREARIMTPDMIEVLEGLAAGGQIYVYAFFGDRKASIANSLFYRLQMAEFIAMNAGESEHEKRVYRITDLGRQALEAAKQKEATK